ncbi:MAG TPA: hypothetical protein ENN23_01015 [Deltaproteobacteria bacterium]|nr:hypothetical protein [Deltaproteobacteria bacterium]
MKKRNIRIFFRIGAAGLAFIMVLGCGYTFTPRGKHIDKRIQRVYVEPFGNKTSQAQIENLLRTAFINHFIQYSRFKVVGSSEEADATVRGTVLNYYTSALSYRPDKLVAQERAHIVVQILFQEKESGKIIWSSRNITENIDYRLQDNINLLPVTRKNALIKLSHDTAEKVVNLMLAGF